MKKSKLIFFAIVVVAVLICVLVVLLPRGEAEPGPTETVPIITDYPDYETTPVITNPPATEKPETTDPYGPDQGMSGIRSEYKLADNVTICKVEKDPNEVIRAYMPIEPDDPEYLPSTEENYNTAEGKVFRNDRTISIEMFDEYTGQTFTVSFGYITGELNRFLYLNPVVEYESGQKGQYGFYFNTMPVGGGSILTLPTVYANEETLKDAKKEAQSFHVGRALDQNKIAAYQDPTHPGTVWFTQTPIQSDLWVDVLVYHLAGDMLATLRLTIAKDADGTYSIVNLENKNLLQTYGEEDAQFSKAELGYIYEISKAAVEDPDVVAFDSYSNLEMCIERCFIEYRNEHTGLYYPYFVPANQSGGSYARSSEFADGPIVAVSFRRTSMVASAATLYFRILKAPTDTEHGVYEYIGRDFLFYNSSGALYNQGYPGI